MDVAMACCMICSFGRLTCLQAEGYEWTNKLCEMDSDGDGETNGHELGDPCCIWQEGGGLPSRAWGLGHPGIVSTNTMANPLQRGCRFVACPFVYNSRSPPLTMLIFLHFIFLSFSLALSFARASRVRHQ